MNFKIKDIKALLTNHITDLITEDNWTPVIDRNELIDMFFKSYYKNDFNFNISIVNTNNVLYTYRDTNLTIQLIGVPHIETLNDLIVFLEEVDKDINNLLIKLKNYKP